MKHRIITLAASVAVLAGGSAFVAPAAHADTPGCVTQTEFAHVKKGWTKKRVHGVFDTIGKRQVISKGGGYTIEIRGYKTCTPYGAVSVSFTNGKLDAKSGVF
jgi:hypothetical protein